MALNAAIQWEVRTTGSDNNGGAFKAGASGTDRSQQDAAHATLTTASTVHTTTTQINVAVGDYTVTAADVGNVVQVTGGTATAGFYEITAVDTGNNRWTVDRAVGTSGQTVAGNMGGGLATLGKAGSATLQAGMIIWVKSGSYVLSTTTQNVSNGVFNFNSVRLHIEGYQTTRGDLGTTPVITATGAISSFTALSVQAAGSWVVNIHIDCAAKATSRGFTPSGAYLCKGSNCTNGAFVSGGFAVWEACEATGCSTAAPFSGAARMVDCVSHDNTVTAFDLSSGNSCAIGCIADTNTGATSDGFALSGNGGAVLNCVAYANGRHGFAISNGILAKNCIAEANGSAGYNLTSAGVATILLNCATYNNGTATYAGNTAETTVIGFIDNTTGTFFTNAAGGDFSLNNTTNQGALARGTGYPGTFPVGSSVGYLDIGAVQHQAAAAGAGASAHVFVG